MTGNCCRFSCSSLQYVRSWIVNQPWRRMDLVSKVLNFGGGGVYPKKSKDQIWTSFVFNIIFKLNLKITSHTQLFDLSTLTNSFFFPGIKNLSSNRSIKSLKLSLNLRWIIKFVLYFKKRKLKVKVMQFGQWCKYHNVKKNVINWF